MHVWKQEKDLWMSTHGVQWKRCLLYTHTTFLSCNSISIAYFFSPASTLFHLVSISPYCSLSLHGSTLFFTTRTHTRSRAQFWFLREGYVLFFFSITRFKGRSNHCCLGPDACGWFHFKTCGSGIFQARTVGSEGYFRVHRHVFKLDMAFNYFVAV